MDIYIVLFAELVAIAVLSVFLYKNAKVHKNNANFSEIKKWYHIAMTDDLTKLHNRAAYTRHIERIKEKGIKHSSPLGIILFDIDDFKNINDSKGHIAGDEALQTVAKMLMKVFSGKNCDVYRIGGDEFAVVAEKTAEDEIINMMLELRHKEANSDIRLSKGYSLITEKKSFKEAFAEADEMLYADKLAKNVKHMAENR